MRARVHVNLFATALFALVASHLAAQEQADRPFIDSVFSVLARTTSLASLLPAQVCGNHAGSLDRLCQGLVAARRTEFTLLSSDAVTGLGQFERVVADKPTWAVAWYGLGIARLQASRAKVVAHEGPRQPLGVSNDAGAGYALARALELDSNFVQAAVALALAPIPREGGSRVLERAAMLERVRRLLPSPSLYAAGLVEREAGRRDSAISFLAMALKRGGVDSGLVELALAREFYSTGHATEGRAMLLRGASDTAAISRKAYHQELQWVAEPTELAQWDSLPGTERSGWLADFWASRDVADGRAPGDRLVEHYRRMEYAFNAYRITVPETGRQQAAGVAGTIDYYADEVIEHFLDHNPIGDGIVGVKPEDAAVYDDVAAMTNLLTEDGKFLGANTPFRMFRTTEDVIDDRGVIFIRQGEPDARAKTVGGEALEVWVYDRPAGPLVLSFREVEFQGTTGASRLVPTLLSANPILRDQLCHLKASICSTNADPTMSTFIACIRGIPCGKSTAENAVGQVGLVTSTGVDRTYDEGKRLSSGTALRREHDEGISAIEAATTTDAFPQHFAHVVTPTIEIYGLDRAGGGAPRLVIAFAIPVNQLVSVATAGRSVYPLHFHLIAANHENGDQYVVDTLRMFATAQAVTSGMFLNGLAEMPVPGGSYSASVAITQDDSRGAVATLDAVTVPGTEAKLAVSDLVLGREDSRVRWNSGATAVPLNPLNTYAKGGDANIYFQLAGLRVGAVYETRLEFFRSEDDLKHAPRLALVFQQTAIAPRTEVSRTLGLKNLEPGQYRVRLTISGDGGRVIASSWLTISK